MKIIKGEIIPKEISDGCPDKCPVCNKKCAAVFRNWKGRTGRVSCEFLHENSKLKTCKRTYNY